MLICSPVLGKVPFFLVEVVVELDVLVDADEELVHLEVAGTESDERTDHDLRLILVAAAEQDDAGRAHLAHEARDEGGIRDDGDVAVARTEFLGEQRATAA